MKKNYKREISKKAYYPQKRMPKSPTIYSLLKEVSIASTITIFDVLEQTNDISSILSKYGNSISDLRNDVFHHKLIVSSIHEYKDAIVDIIKTFPMTIRQKYIDRINKCAEECATTDDVILSNVVFLIDSEASKIIINHKGVK